MVTAPDGGDGEVQGLEERDEERVLLWSGYYANLGSHLWEERGGEEVRRGVGEGSEGRGSDYYKYTFRYIATYGGSEVSQNYCVISHVKRCRGNWYTLRYENSTE